MAFYYGIHNVAQYLMSAFGGKADMAYCTAKCPLMTQSGQSSQQRMSAFLVNSGNAVACCE